MRFLSNRHRRLMSESEQALVDAAAGTIDRRARIAARVLDDETLYRRWESQHAELVRPVAEHRKRSPQIVALRLIETSLLHRCSLIDYIRQNQVTGDARDRLFSAFYGPRETLDAMLVEHRQYQLSVSSSLSADHLLDVMHDPQGTRMLERYRDAWSNYYSLYCFAVSATDSEMASAVRVAVRDAKSRVHRLKIQLLKRPPAGGGFDFDREALLAKSGRYPVLDFVGR